MSHKVFLLTAPEGRPLELVCRISQPARIFVRSEEYFVGLQNFECKVPVNYCRPCDHEISLTCINEQLISTKRGQLDPCVVPVADFTKACGHVIKVRSLYKT